MLADSLSTSLECEETISVPEHKCVLVGPPEVGKTTLLEALLKKDTPGNTLPTVAAQTAVIRLHGADGEVHDLRIWDTAGQERFSALMPVYLRGSHLVFVVVSPATTQDQLERIEEKLAQMKWHPTPRVIHVLNKTDLYSKHAVYQAKIQLDSAKKESLWEVVGQGATRRWCCTAAKLKQVWELLEELHHTVGRLPSPKDTQNSPKKRKNTGEIEQCC